MTVEQLIRIAILLSIMLIVISFALLATWREATCLFRQPSQLFRSLLSMNVIMPLFAAALVGIFSLHPALEVALVAVSVSPVPPFLPVKQLKVVGHHEYVYGLLGASSLLVIVLAPLSILLIALAFSRDAHISPLAIGKMVALTVFTPFALGLIIHRLNPTFAERASPIANKVGTVLLIVAFVPVLIKMWPAMVALIGDGTLLAIIAFVVVGLVAGHLLGGPDPRSRTVLALATATRHPGVAMVISAASLEGSKLVAPALILYLLVAAIATAPYTIWRKRQRLA